MKFEVLRLEEGGRFLRRKKKMRREPFLEPKRAPRGLSKIVATSPAARGKRLD